MTPRQRRALRRAGEIAGDVAGGLSLFVFFWGLWVAAWVLA